MKAPSVFIVVQTNGDGYGHNSITYLEWYFDEDEAKAREKHFREVTTTPGFWFDVEEVPAPDPIPKRRSW